VHLGSTTLTAKIFEQFIIDEFECRQVKDKCTATKDKALSADSSKKKSKDKKNVECFNCRKKGHYKSECHALDDGQEGKGSKQGKSAKDDATPAEKEVPEAWAAIQDLQEPNAAAHAPLSVELYDSRVLCHMSPSRDCFKSYQEIALCVITAADKRVFYTVGIGDLEIEVPNGKSTTPILLKDVLHAPEMGTIIILVNRIAKASYSVIFKDNTC
jgi:hypothetical protein